MGTWLGSVTIRSSQAQAPATRLVRRRVPCDAGLQPEGSGEAATQVVNDLNAALSGRYHILRVTHGPPVRRTYIYSSAN